MLQIMAMIFVQESGKRNAQRGRVRTLTWRRTRATVTTAVRFLLTVTETSGRRALAMTETIRRLRELGGADEWFGVVTEWIDSMAPRCKTDSSYCNSVWPNCSNRLHRGENLDQLNDFGETERNESVRPKAIKRFWKLKPFTDRWLRVLLTRRVRI